MEVPQGFEHIYEQIGQELEAGEIPEGKELERAMEIHQQWCENLEKHYEVIMNHCNPPGKVDKVVLLLLKTIYGTVQAAMAFFKELMKAFKHLKYNRSAADPCLHYKWSEEGKLIVWLSWVDDCVVGGSGQDPMTKKRKMKQLFECDDSCELVEYIGNKVHMDRKNGLV